MTTPAQMISTARDPGFLASLDYLPRIDYGTSIVLAGVLVIGAVMLARRLTRGTLNTQDVENARAAISATSAATEAKVRPAGKLAADTVRAMDEDAVVRRKVLNAATEAGRVLAHLRATTAPKRFLMPLMDLPEVTWQHTRPME